MKSASKTALFLLTIIMTFSFFLGATKKMEEYEINLPKIIGVWTRPDSPQIINSKNIFEYMNGAGELYLGYRFKHLEVYEYTIDSQNNILVELYFMKTSDDAFGLLSLDWGGKQVTLNNSPLPEAKHSTAPSNRALYGEGLLRIWSDNIYARVMAYHEMPASKEAVLSLGRAITANRKNPSQPELLKILPPAFGTDWKLQKNKIVYFHSYLVLNSFYYLSHHNILNLDLSTEAVSAPYEKTTDMGDHKHVQFLFVKYANPDRALQALDHFHKVYLPEYKKKSVAGSATKISNIFKVEDGWLGYKLYGECIALVFECPDQESARMIMNQIEFNVL